MKDRLILLLFTLLLLLQTPFSISAQPDPDKPAKGLIKGTVIDESTGQPLDYATITIFSSEDSSMVTGGVTDVAGTFNLEVKFGSYYANVAFISFTDRDIGGIEVNRDTPIADLGAINLAPNATTLAEVEVRAEKSNMQISLDKRVFNVGKDLANIGGSASDVLDNVPSVTVDAEGGGVQAQRLHDGAEQGGAGAQRGGAGTARPPGAAQHAAQAARFPAGAAGAGQHGGLGPVAGRGGNHRGADAGLRADGSGRRGLTS